MPGPLPRGVGTVTYAVTAGALPTGITLATAGVLSGTPTVTGTFNFTVTATDANGCTGTRAYTLVVGSHHGWHLLPAMFTVFPGLNGSSVRTLRAASRMVLALLGSVTSWRRSRTLRSA